MVLPVGDLNPTRRVPHVNWLFIAINIGVFLWQSVALSACEQVRFVYQFAAIPREILSLSPLPQTTAEELLGGCAGLANDKIVLMSLVSSMFLHGGPWHLGGNMLFLYVFGDNVEDRLGRLRYVLFYAAGGISSALAYSFIRPESNLPMVGASGAIAAILGAYLILYPRAKVLTYVPFPLYLLAWLIPGIRMQAWLLIFAIVTMPAWLLLVGWIGLQFVAVGSPGVSVGSPGGGLVAYEAHIAGFAVGVLLLLLVDHRRTERGHEPFHPVRPRRQPG